MTPTRENLIEALRKAVIAAEKFSDQLDDCGEEPHQLTKDLLTNARNVYWSALEWREKQ